MSTRTAQLATIPEAAIALSCSERHIKRLIAEAETLGRRARWRFGRELIDLAPVGSARRMVRVNLGVVIPVVEVGK